MAEQYFAQSQQNVGWGLTLKMSGKAPAVAERIWRTYSDALAYANDFNSSATNGLALSILQDSVVGNKTYKAGIYFLKNAATAEGANDAVLVPTGMSEEDLTTLVNSKIKGNVASIDDISFSDNSLHVLYTTVGGEQQDLEVDLPNADETKDGLMTAEHVKSLGKKIEGVKINGVTLSNGNGVVAGDFSFGLDSDETKIILQFDGKEIGHVDVADFVKDGILDSVEIVNADASGNVGTFMKFIFNTDSGKSPIYMNVENLIDIYEFGSSQVTAGNYVVPTITVHGTGSTNDPWQIELNIDDSAIGEGFDLVLEHIDNVSKTVNENKTTLQTIQENVENLVSVGGEANTIVTILVNGVEITPDANRVVSIPLATTSATGVMSAADKAKLDSIEEMSEADILEAIQAAFDNAV